MGRLRSSGCFLCGSLIVLLAGAGALRAQSSEGARKRSAGEPVSIGEKLQIRSEILNEVRPLIIAKPAGYERGTERYPVLYLLDGEEHFVHAAGIVSFLAESERIPEMLVVAVANTNRSRDLTPPSTAENDIRFTPVNGGADTFLRFFTEELIPYVERNYRTRPYRILVGHSFGGLFALHALTRRPDVFRAYIASSPSLNWNRQALVAEAETLFKKTTELNSDIYITAADEGGAALSAVRRFVAVLDERAPKGLRWTLREMTDETHVSAPHLSIYLGLDTIFAPWHLANPLELYDKGGLDAVHRHFGGAKRFGYERTTPPFTVSLIVTGLVRADRLEEAEAVLLHDPKSYPPPWNQLDALARAYEKHGDTGQVIRYYRLSLQQNPTNEYARKRLKELGVEVEPATGKPAQ